MITDVMDLIIEPITIVPLLENPMTPVVDVTDNWSYPIIIPNDLTYIIRINTHDWVILSIIPMVVVGHCIVTTWQWCDLPNIQYNSYSMTLFYYWWWAGQWYYYYDYYLFNVW